MTCRNAVSILVAAALLVLAAEAAVAEVTAEQADETVTIKIDGKLFAQYRGDSTCKDHPHLGPVVWPIIGPTGKEMTRFYPMADAKPAERTDHQHHRSLWFNHGDVNGLSFWHRAVIKHREFVKVEGGEQAVVVTRNDWLDNDGKALLEDERTLTFGTDGDSRWIDFDITLTAVADEVKFGDTKEGTMGIRVPGTMKVDAKPSGGKIVNSEGQTDGGAWGKAAAWVDYHGPVEGETLGIAMMNHPSSFRYPTYWHVRTYGLFAANPFGLHNFKGRDSDGSHTLAKGESMTFRYRVLFHLGDEKQGKVAEVFDAYGKQGK